MCMNRCYKLLRDTAAIAKELREGIENKDRYYLDPSAGFSAK